jgi:hypothetical protein
VLKIIGRDANATFPAAGRPPLEQFGVRCSALAFLRLVALNLNGFIVAIKR